MTAQPERPPKMVTVVGGAGPSLAASQSAGPNDPEPLFQPGPSQSSQSVRMSQQDVLDMAGMGDLDLEAMLEDAEEEDQMDAMDDTEEAIVPDVPDVPAGWEDIEADFANISGARQSTQREDIVAAQRVSGNESSISQRQFTLSRHGSSSDSIRPIQSCELRRSSTRESIEKPASREGSRRESGSGHGLEREPSRKDSGAGPSREPSRRESGLDRALSREPSRRESEAGRSRSREPSRGSTSRPRSREPSVREGSTRASTSQRRNSSSQFKPDMTMFGDTRIDDSVVEDDDEHDELALGPTQQTGRVFETFFDD